VPLIGVQNLTARYPRAAAPALKDVTFRVERGETLLLLGPSGSGKSTIGLCLAGLVPDSIPAVMQGTILLEGQDASDLTVSERTARIGMVFQDPEAQFCMLTVEDEVAFGLENMAMPREEMEGRIREALDRVGLGERRRERVDRLSGGQKQRLALAGVLARRPDVLFLDEPTANLDPATRHEFFQWLGRLRRERPDLTIIIVEHILDDLIALVDRVLLLQSDGALFADDAPGRVFDTMDDELDRMGIWLPQVTALGHKLRQAGRPLAHLPLTVEQAVQEFGPLIQRMAVVAPPHHDACGAPLTRPGDASALSARHLTYSYAGGPPVLRDVSMNAPAGSFLAVVGPNGSGKTTLVSHFAGVLRARRNRVWLFDTDIATLSSEEIAAHVGFVFQNPEHQFVENSVESELAYSLRVRRRPAAEITRTVEQLLDTFGLTPLRHMNPFRLSQGQKRRLSVATMLAVGQDILILDEPTFGQDRHTAHALMERLCALHRAGVTIIVITHDMQLVADYAEQVAVLLQGQIEFTGAAPALFDDGALLERASLRALPLHDLARAAGVRYADGTSPLTIREWFPFFGLDIAPNGYSSPSHTGETA
jgi:energy-coupling factor transport system ATP-binding protein